MWFWWFMLSCNLLIPLIMLIGGRITWKHCPKKINSLVGYRTNHSMKNMDTWKFAHEYFGKLWWRIGWIILLPTIIAHIPVYGASEDTIGIAGSIIMMVLLIILLISIIPTEKALKKTFNDDGTRK